MQSSHSNTTNYDTKPDQELLTKSELATRLRLKERTIDLWWRNGRLPGLKLSAKCVRFSWFDVCRALGIPHQ